MYKVNFYCGAGKKIASETYYSNTAMGNLEEYAEYYKEFIGAKSFTFSK